MDSPIRYRISPLRSLAHVAAGLVPAPWREPFAEFLLRRAGAPGAAAEHACQYRLGRGRDEAAIGADQFYRHQYRQFLNPAMGAFVQTASQALLASGGRLEGRLWRRHRRSHAAMLEQRGEAPPLLVLNPETVALALMLPRPKRAGEAELASRWLSGAGPMPAYYRALIEGTEIGGGEPGIRMRETAAAGMALAVLEAVLASRRLAVLALHPDDPDGLGLHLTLFGVEAMAPDEMRARFGLEPSAIAAYRYEARRTDQALVFCVGATEEVFTRRPQNLFLKRPAPPGSRRPRRDPLPPLQEFVARQFEVVQVGVSAGGLPGASARSGDLGRAAFVARQGRKLLLLIPHHPGDGVHGHAAKLWSNPYGTVVLSDDHDSLCRIAVSGPAGVIDPATASRRFPDIVAQLLAQPDPGGEPMSEPDYWFVQEIAELCRQREPLAPKLLDAARPAGGQDLPGQRPDSLDAGSLPPYDTELRHRREAAGLEEDPTGACYYLWQAELQGAMQARLQHLDEVLQRPFRWDRGGAGELPPPLAPSSRPAADSAPPP